MSRPDLREFGWHTGGAVRPLGDGEPRPVVFRDLGPEATLRLLEGRLGRLAGPTSPVTYLRTAGYAEPFVDHGHFGRVCVLASASAELWHAGIVEVFIASADAGFEPQQMALVPDDADLAGLAEGAAAMRDARELSDHLGGAIHDAWRADTAERLRGFARELAAVEAHLAPLRRAFQAPGERRRQAARDRMAALGLSEVDLCAAWHHIAPARRAEIAALVEAVDLGASLGEAAP